MSRDNSEIYLDNEFNNTDSFEPYEQAKNNLYNKQLNLNSNLNVNYLINKEDKEDSFIDRKDLKNINIKNELRHKLLDNKLDINNYIKNINKSQIKGEFKIENIFKDVDNTSVDNSKKNSTYTSFINKLSFVNNNAQSESKKGSINNNTSPRKEIIKNDISQVNLDTPGGNTNQNTEMKNTILIFNKINDIILVKTKKNTNEKKFAKEIQIVGSYEGVASAQLEELYEKSLGNYTRQEFNNNEDKNITKENVLVNPENFLKVESLYFGVGNINKNNFTHFTNPAFARYKAEKIYNEFINLKSSRKIENDNYYKKEKLDEIKSYIMKYNVYINLENCLKELLLKISNFYNNLNKSRDIVENKLKYINLESLTLFYLNYKLFDVKLSSYFSCNIIKKEQANNKFSSRNVIIDSNEMIDDNEKIDINNFYISLKNDVIDDIIGDYLRTITNFHVQNNKGNLDYDYEEYISSIIQLYIDFIMKDINEFPFNADYFMNEFNINIIKNLKNNFTKFNKMNNNLISKKIKDYKEKLNNNATNKIKSKYLYNKNNNAIKLNNSKLKLNITKNIDNSISYDYKEDNYNVQIFNDLENLYFKFKKYFYIKVSKDFKERFCKYNNNISFKNDNNFNNVNNKSILNCKQENNANNINNSKYTTNYNITQINNSNFNNSRQFNHKKINTINSQNTTYLRDNNINNIDALLNSINQKNSIDMPINNLNNYLLSNLFLKIEQFYLDNNSTCCSSFKCYLKKRFAYCFICSCIVCFKCLKYHSNHKMFDFCNLYKNKFYNINGFQDSLIPKTTAALSKEDQDNYYNLFNDIVLNYILKNSEIPIIEYGYFKPDEVIKKFNNICLKEEVENNNNFEDSSQDPYNDKYYFKDSNYISIIDYYQALLIEYFFKEYIQIIKSKSYAQNLLENFTKNNGFIDKIQRVFANIIDDDINKTIKLSILKEKKINPESDYGSVIVDCKTIYRHLDNYIKSYNIYYKLIKYKEYIISNKKDNRTIIHNYFLSKLSCELGLSTIVLDNIKYNNYDIMQDNIDIKIAQYNSPKHYYIKNFKPIYKLDKFFFNDSYNNFDKFLNIESNDLTHYYHNFNNFINFYLSTNSKLKETFINITENKINSYLNQIINNQLILSDKNYYCIHDNKEDYNNNFFLTDLYNNSNVKFNKNSIKFIIKILLKKSDIHGLKGNLNSYKNVSVGYFDKFNFKQIIKVINNILENKIILRKENRIGLDFDEKNDNNDIINEKNSLKSKKFNIVNNIKSNTKKDSNDLTKYTSKNFINSININNFKSSKILNNDISSSRKIKLYVKNYIPFFDVLTNNKINESIDEDLNSDYNGSFFSYGEFNSNNIINIVTNLYELSVSINSKEDSIQNDNDLNYDENKIYNYLEDNGNIRNGFKSKLDVVNIYLLSFFENLDFYGKFEYKKKE